MRLQGKISLVTGASSGIGAATAAGFAREGSTVILSDIDQQRGRQVTSDICSGGGSAEFIPLDVTNPSEWAAMEAKLNTDYAGLDVIVNNAGMGMAKPFEDISLEDWRQLMSVNLDSVFMGSQMAIRLMKDRSTGSIINVSSIYGIVGEAMATAYSASKGGVRSLSKSIALYCCERGYKIRCNSMHPGFIETRIGETGVMQIDEHEGAALQERITGGISMGGLGSANDIANGMVFLASDESSYMTGTEFVIDGGYTAH